MMGGPHRDADMRRPLLPTGAAFAVAFALGSLLVYPGGLSNAARVFEPDGDVRLRVENAGADDLLVHVLFQTSTGGTVLEESFVAPAERVIEKRVVNLPPGAYVLTTEWRNEDEGGRSTLATELDTKQCGAGAPIRIRFVADSTDGVAFPEGAPVASCVQ